MKQLDVPSGFLVRRLGADDLSAFRDVRLESLSTCPSAFSSSFEEEAQQPLSHFESRLNSSMIIGVWADERLFGMVGLALRGKVKLRHKAELWGMFVRAEARRRGLGRVLLQYVISRVPEGVEEVTLGVTTSSAAALKLYQSAAFEIYGKEPRAIKTTGTYHDEILMRLPLGGSSQPSKPSAS